MNNEPSFDPREPIFPNRPEVPEDPSFAYWRPSKPEDYEPPRAPEEPEEDGEEEITPADIHDKRKTLNIVRTMVGVALILVGSALLVALLTWLKQDIGTTLQFLQSEIK